eukprot:5612381-Pyramimonas_sp.AAC.1
MALMSKAWFDILRNYGWRVPLGETSRCTTATDDASTLMSVSVDGVSLKRAPRAEGFRVLGTIVTFNNSHEAELDNRISCAWRAFY